MKKEEPRNNSSAVFQLVSWAGLDWPKFPVDMISIYQGIKISTLRVFPNLFPIREVTRYVWFLWSISLLYVLVYSIGPMSFITYGQPGPITWSKFDILVLSNIVDMLLPLWLSYHKSMLFHVQPCHFKADGLFNKITYYYNFWVKWSLHKVYYVYQTCSLFRRLLCFN